MQRGRCKLFMLVFALLVQSLVVIAVPAHASVGGWPQDVGSTASGHVKVTPEGSVVVSSCDSTGQIALKTLYANGAEESSVPQRPGVYTSACWSQGAIGKDGTVFGITDDYRNHFTIVAYRKGTLLWEKRLEGYCANYGVADRAIYSLQVGADGYLYAVTVNPMCQYSFLDKFDPSSGELIFEKALGRGVNWFSTYDQGVIIQNTSYKISYFKYDGTTFTPPNLARAGEGGWIRTTTADGRLFVATDQYSRGECPKQSYTAVLQAYTPATGTIFSFSWPACWEIKDVKAVNNGGLAIYALDNANLPTLISYVPNGAGFTAHTVRLESTKDYRNFKQLPYEYDFLPARITTDITGNILLVREYNWKDGDNALIGWQFTLQKPDLTITAEADTNWFDFKQTTKFAKAAQWAVERGRLYVSIGYCANATGNCTNRSQILYAMPMLGMDQDYPRATVLGLQPIPAECPTVEFIGARGSGEGPFEFDGLGKTVQDAKNSLAAQGVSMKVTSLPYPAVKVAFTEAEYPSDYSNSVKAGIELLSGYITQLHVACPNTKVILAGYSQGAHVVGDVVTLLPLTIQNQIAGIVLFGDPLFNPTQTQVDKGTYENWRGIWSAEYGPGGLPPRQFQENLVSKASSYCLKGDFVCNFDTFLVNAGKCKADEANCPHGLYASEWTQKAATWLKGKI